MGINTFTSTAGRQVRRLYAEESGATAIEYAMVASGIGVVVSTVVYTLGDKVKNPFTLASNMFS